MLQRYKVLGFPLPVEVRTTCGNPKLPDLSAKAVLFSCTAKHIQLPEAMTKYAPIAVMICLLGGSAENHSKAVCGLASMHAARARAHMADRDFVCMGTDRRNRY